jgi:thymidylate synthase
MWHLIEADTANDLWMRVIDALRLDRGARIQPSRGGDTREILHVALTLRKPRERWTTVRRPAMNPAFALAEVFWLMAGRHDATFVSYFNRSLARFAGNAPRLHGAYGYRLRHHFQLDQLMRAYEALRANPDTRQVVLQIWDPNADFPQSDGQPRDPDIPCNTQSIVKVRDGKLEWLQILRSNDAFLGLPHNIIQFTMLQEILAGWLNIALGDYHHVSDSLHVYNRDVAFVEPSSSEISISGDSFSLPRDESVSVIATVEHAIDHIVDERNTAAEISHLPLSVALPASYHNALRVLVAEGLRRRNAYDEMNSVMAMCTSAIFKRMWADWCDRLQITARRARLVDCP